MFVKEAWYVAAAAPEIGRTPFARSVCGEPIVFFRSEDGTPRALADRCIHRRLPLSKGRLVGDRLVCGYHGFTYAADGRCVAVPGQDRVPRRAALRAYPVVEKYGWIWVWMGAPEAADASLLPAMPGLETDGWVPFGDRLHVGAHYQLLVDNLIDLSHETYVHGSSIGNEAVAETPIESRRGGKRGVRRPRHARHPAAALLLGGGRERRQYRPLPAGPFPAALLRPCRGAGGAAGQ